MIDFKTYKELHPKPASVSTGMRSSERVYKLDVDEETEAPGIFLFPSQIPGFNFRTKKWSKSSYA